ncbi:putative multidrug export ATP-binding/permease protein [Streptomyces sp. MBT84]|uniref:ATP-binding cassette domain-containing protein n=1 Tax=unclassified Streptomyces TaxID=2593676 RepID=UPI001DD0B345|nr:putative multidrug export ATP-binding/permease protein [Streptomyces sp. MBT84]
MLAWISGHRDPTAWHPRPQGTPSRSRGTPAISQVLTALALLITFRYPGADRAVLEGLSFSVRPGELVIITGPSGAGKSTVAMMLLRFYDPASGSVLLDSTPIRDLPPARLREYVTLLPQETLVLHDTVRANIACGRPGASDRAIVEAARAADAHEFIVRLPGGYGTEVDPHTPRPSGGRLQHLGIARAVLGDAPVLVLDEPTTGLDAMAARRVLAPLRRLTAGRTTIMITHDLNLAPDADRVLVVDRGRAVETGRAATTSCRPGAGYSPGRTTRRRTRGDRGCRSSPGRLEPRPRSSRPEHADAALGGVPRGYARAIGACGTAHPPPSGPFWPGGPTSAPRGQLHGEGPLFHNGTPWHGACPAPGRPVQARHGFTHLTQSTTLDHQVHDAERTSSQLHWKAP